MNIDATNLLSPVLSGGTGEAAAPPVIVDGTGVAESFSGTLMTQIGLLNNLKAGGALPSEMPNGSGMQNVSGGQEVAMGQNAPNVEDVAGVGKNIVNLQGLAGVDKNIANLQGLVGVDKNIANLQDGAAGQQLDVPQKDVSASANKIDVQEIAVLAGNDLPVTYKANNNDADHEAALAAVNDSLKYISANASPGDTMAQATQQNMNNKVVMPKVTEQAATDVTTIIAPQVQQAAQNKKINLAQEPTQDVTQEAVVIDVSAQKAALQVAAAQVNDESSQNQAEGEVRESTDDQNAAEALLASMLLSSTAPPTEPVKTVNSLMQAPVDTVTQELPLLSEAETATENNSAPVISTIKGPANTQQGEAVFSFSVQTKQEFGLKDVGNYGQAEKIGQVDPQVPNTEAGKVAPNVNAAAVQISKTDVENKTEALAISKPLSHPEWNKDLGDRIVWMSNKSIPTAEIRLNPQHLGPISVRVNVSEDQASVVFTAQHAVVRETLEASIPKLREMMSAQNINLTDVNVTQNYTSDQGRSQSQNSAQSFTDDAGRRQGNEASVADGGDEVIEQEIDSGRAVVSKGLLSLYA